MTPTISAAAAAAAVGGAFDVALRALQALNSITPLLANIVHKKVPGNNIQAVYNFIKVIKTKKNAIMTTHTTTSNGKQKFIPIFNK